MTQLTNTGFYAIELTPLGDLFKNIRVMPADDKWTVPYLKYSYRSIYHTKNFKKDFYCGEEEPIEVPGSWSFIGTSGSEEDCAKVVEYDELSEGYEHYMSDEEARRHDRIDLLPTAHASFRSLLKSKGLDPSKRYAILKQG
jgi:hypothetical protein